MLLKFSSGLEADMQLIKEGARSVKEWTTRKVKTGRINIQTTYEQSKKKISIKNLNFRPGPSLIKPQCTF